MHDINSRIHAITLYKCFVEILLGCIQFRMYIIQIMLVQKYAHACVHTPGNAKEASQLVQPRTSECVARLLVCTRANAMHDVKSRTNAIFPV